MVSGTLLDTVDFRTFPSSHKVLWFSTALKSRIISFPFSKPSSNVLCYHLYLIILVPSPPRPSLTSSPFTPHSLCSNHPVLLMVPSKCQGCTCRTQALCLLFPLPKYPSPNSCMNHSLIPRPLLRHPLHKAPFPNESAGPFFCLHGTGHQLTSES